MLPHKKEILNKINRRRVTAADLDLNSQECDLALLRFRKICVIDELLPLLGGLGL